MIPNCDPTALPDIQLSFPGSVLLSIPGSIYTFSDDSGNCYPTFVDSIPNQGTDWLLGDLLHRAYYVAYHVGEKKVCFAESLSSSYKYYTERVGY